MRKILFFLVIILFNTVYVIGQINYEENPDSLYSQSKKYFTSGQYANAIEYCIKSQYIYIEQGNDKGISDTYNLMGNIYGSIGNYETAILKYNKALLISQKTGDSYGIAAIKTNMGSIYLQQGKFGKASVLLMEGHDLFNKLLQEVTLEKDENQIRKIEIQLTNVLNSFGILYAKQDNMQKSLEYFLQTLKIKKKLEDKLGAANLCINVGNIYRDWQKDYEKALIYYKEALELYEELDNKSGVASVYQNFGSVFLLQGLYDKAQVNIEQSLIIAKDECLYDVIAPAYYDMGKIYNEQKMYLKAIEYFDKSAIEALKMNNKNLLAEIYKTLSNTFSSNGNDKKALYYLNLYSLEKDSIYQSENVKAIAEIQVRYETERKEQENILLRKDNIIQKSEIKNANQRQNIFIIILIFMFLILIVSILNYISYKKRQKLETENLIKELSLLKSEAIVKQVTNNINYQVDKLNRKNIEIISGGKINDTDWKIITILAKNPVISNNQLAEEAFLSIPGVRSSLKKMYDLFDIKPTENKKLSLTIKVTRISSQK